MFDAPALLANSNGIVTTMLATRPKLVFFGLTYAFVAAVPSKMSFRGFVTNCHFVTSFIIRRWALTILMFGLDRAYWIGSCLQRVQTKQRVIPLDGAED